MPNNSASIKADWLWKKGLLAFALWPLSVLFCLLVRIRYRLFQRGLLSTEKLPVTVIVVGNISLGGNGKTPLVVSLVHLLQQRGFHPGILTRGYKSDYEHQTTLLSSNEISDRAGDEANMLSQLCGCPIAVGADRVKSGRALLQRFRDIDIIVTDDGLQHYALARDMEIIVQRAAAYGNGFCLPAGPLREPRSRLSQADLVVNRDGAELIESFGRCWNLQQPGRQCEVTDFAGKKVYALAGIGFPELFFDALKQYGLNPETHAFGDHHAYTAQDLASFNDAPLLVTHKDAVKLKALGGDNIWVVPLELTLSDDLQYRLFTLLESKIDG